ncbi:hypothetical protein QBC41DRAFT_306002 [Cercophora samala]|uniref:Uncharacterized protein n=1 Tax=Cercophora samala TaxID=330535 RepID=A0AA39Z7G8_9PEZI|nr:hypothetical protein QBC41DRAFT_306002 [Cercophora samala]
MAMGEPEQHEMGNMASDHSLSPPADGYTHSISSPGVTPATSRDLLVPSSSVQSPSNPSTSGSNTPTLLSAVNYNDSAGSVLLRRCPQKRQISRIAVVHGVPLIVTLLVIIINHKSQFFFDWDIALGTTPKDLLNWLQLVAKAHEVLIVGSLGAMVLKIFKSALLGTQGLPLGLITGSYRVGDIVYIFRPAFWTNLFYRPASRSCDAFKPMLLAAFLLIATLLASFAGPASAILLIPSADWFKMEKSEVFNKLQSPIYYGLPADRIWPRVLEGEDAQPSLRGCNTPAGAIAYWCPSAGYQQLWNWVSKWQLVGLSDTVPFNNPVGATRRLINVNTSPDLTFSTTVSMATIMTVTRFLDYINHQTKSFRVQTLDAPGIFQPLVQTQCNALENGGLDNHTALEFKYNSIDCFNDPDCEASLGELAGWARPNPGPRARVEVLAPKLTDKHPVLIQATLPYVERGDKKLLEVGCVVMAHWIPAPPIQASLNESEFIGELSGNAVKGLADVSSGAMMIKITNSWMPYLNMERGTTAALSPEKTVAPDDSAFSNITSGIADLIDLAMNVARLDSGEYSTTFGPGTSDMGFVIGPLPDELLGEELSLSAKWFLEKIISVVFVDGLARVESQEASFVTIRSNETTLVVADLGVQAGPTGSNIIFDSSNGTRVEGLDGHRSSIFSPNDSPDAAREIIEGLVKFPLDAERYGYGFGKATSGRHFAFTVMYTYLFVLVVYSIILFGSFCLRHDHGGGIVSSWSDLQEVLVLAWSSDPRTALQDKVGGAVNTKSAERKSLWRLPTGIRVGPGSQPSRVQLVVQDVVGVEKLKEDRKYR